MQCIFLWQTSLDKKTMVFLCKLDVYNLNFSMNTFLSCVPSCFRKGQTKFINPSPLTHVTRIRETQQQDSLLIERHTSFLQTFHVVLTNQWDLINICFILTDFLLFLRHWPLYLISNNFAKWSVGTLITIMGIPNNGMSE